MWIPNSDEMKELMALAEPHELVEAVEEVGTEAENRLNDSPSPEERIKLLTLLAWSDQTAMEIKDNVQK